MVGNVALLRGQAPLKALIVCCLWNTVKWNRTWARILCSFFSFSLFLMLLSLLSKPWYSKQWELEWFCLLVIHLLIIFIHSISFSLVCFAVWIYGFERLLNRRRNLLSTLFYDGCSFLQSSCFFLAKMNTFPPDAHIFLV